MAHVSTCEEHSRVTALDLEHLERKVETSRSVHGLGPVGIYPSIVLYNHRIARLLPLYERCISILSLNVLQLK